MTKKQSSHCFVALLRCRMQCCSVFLVRSIDGGSATKKQSNYCFVAFLRRNMQRCSRSGVGVAPVDGSALIESSSNLLQIPFKGDSIKLLLQSIGGLRVHEKVDQNRGVAHTREQATKQMAALTKEKEGGQMKAQRAIKGCARAAQS